MNQAIVSYVLSKVAKIADVDSGDVHTTMLRGSIVLNNVRLRKDTLNKILPIPIDRGDVPELSIKIPNPTTSNPVRVEVKGAHLLFPLDLEHQPTERTMEEILMDISEATIFRLAGALPSLGAAPAADDGDDGMLSSSYWSVSDSLDTSSPLDMSDTQSMRSFDDDDLRSCNSGYDGSDADSSSFMSSDDEQDTDPVLADGPRKGWLAYFRDRATRSMEWIWQRRIEIVFTDLTVRLPCDARKNISFDFKVESFAVTIEPSQNMGAESLKVTSVVVSDTSVMANTGTTLAKVVSVAKVGITVTKVHATESGTLLRSNTAIDFPSLTSVMADEETLLALLHCTATRDIMMSLPVYCRPFASLRQELSLWPFAAACVLARVRDRRQRYNFNLSHLRFFAHSRERYLQLLEDCHRSRAVGPRRQELAEAEQDLRYPDVILALRQRLQRRYAAAVSTALVSAAQAEAPAPLPSLSGVQVLTSTHLDWAHVRIALPAKSVIDVFKTSVIIRDNEKTFSISDIALGTGSAVQRLKKSGASPALPPDTGATAATTAVSVGRDEAETWLVRVRQRTAHEDKGGAQDTKVELVPLGLSLRIDTIHAIALPLADAVGRLGLKHRLPVAAIESSAHAAEAQAARVARTFICVVPRILVRLDDVALLVDRLSLTSSAAAAIGSAPAPPKLGCSLRELSVRCGDGAYLVSPLTVKMTSAADGIVVSPVQVLVNMSCWAYLCTVRDRLHELMDRIPAEVLVQQAKLAAAGATEGHTGATYALLEKCRNQLPEWRRMKQHGQNVTVAGLRLTFEPLNVCVSVGRISANSTKHSPSSSPAPAAGDDPASAPAQPRYGAHIRVGAVSLVTSHGGSVKVTLALDDGVDVYLGQVRHRRCSQDSGTPIRPTSTAATVVRVSSVVVSTEPCRPGHASFSAPQKFSASTAAGATGAPPIMTMTMTTKVAFSAAQTSPARAAQVTLVHITVVSVVLVAGGYTHVTLGTVAALNGGLTMAPVQVLLRADPAAAVSNLRPYRATFAQLSLTLAEIAPHRACAVRIDRVVPVCAGIVNFLVEELIPTQAYQVFFSGLTDVAVSLDTADPRGCLLLSPPAESAPSLWLTLRPLAPRLQLPPLSATMVALRPFGILLPCVAGGALLVATNDIATLAVNVACQHLRLGVRCDSARCDDGAPSSGEVSLELSDLVATLPIAMQPFWTEDIQATPASATRAAVGSVTVSLGSHCAESEGCAAELAGVSLASLSFEDAPAGTAGTTQSPATPQPRAPFSPPSGAASLADRASSHPSESESASCASAEDEQRGVSVALDSWDARVDFSHPLPNYGLARQLVDAIAGLSAGAAAAAASASVPPHETVAGSASCQNWDLGQAGSIYLSACETDPSAVVLVESCTFTWSSEALAAGHSVVVCPNTAVLFKGCVFKAPLGTRHAEHVFVRSANPSTGVFVCQDCAEADTSAPPSTTAPRQAQANRAAPPSITVAARNDGATVAQAGGGAAAGAALGQSIAVTVRSGTAAIHLDSATSVVCCQTGLAVYAATTATRRRITVARLHCQDLYGDLAPRAPAGAKKPPSSLRLFSKVSADAEVTLRPTKAFCGVNGSVSIVQVCVPLIPDSLAFPVAVLSYLAAMSRAESPAPNSELVLFDPLQDARMYQQQQQQQQASSRIDDPPATTLAAVIPLASWKILLSLSMTPVRVVLPSGTPVCTLTLSNAYLWSRKEAAGDAQFDARLALHDVAVWDFLEQRLRPVFSAPYYLGAQGHITEEAAGTLQLTSSPCEAVLTSTQVRLATSVLADLGAALAAAAALGAAGVTLVPPVLSSCATAVNHSGVRLSLRSCSAMEPAQSRTASATARHGGSASRSSSTPVSTHSRAAAADSAVLVDGVGRATLPYNRNFPPAPAQLIEAADSGAFQSSVGRLSPPTAVELAPRTQLAAYGLGDTVAAQAHYVTLTDGTVLHVTSALLQGSLVQEVHIRTVFQVKNETVFDLRFTSRYTQVESRVEAGAVSCIPAALMVCPDLNVATCVRARQADSDDGVPEVVSLRERLWTSEMPALQLAQRAAADAGSLPPTVTRGFVSQLDGSRVHLGFEFCRQGRVVMMHVRPSQPAIRNGTRFPLTVTVAASDSSRKPALPPVSALLAPGEVLDLYDLDPAASFGVDVCLDAHGERFASGADRRAPLLLFPPQVAALGGKRAIEEGGYYGETPNGVIDESLHAVGCTVPLRMCHERQPRRFDFDIAAVLEWRTRGGKSRVWTVAALNLATLVNACALDLAVTSSKSGTSAGSLGERGLRQSSDGYVPTATDLVLRAPCTEASEPFEVSDAYSGGLVVCSPMMAAAGGSGTSKDATGKAAFFLVKPSERGAGCPAASRPSFDIIPPLVIVNENRTAPLTVVHAAVVHCDDLTARGMPPGAAVIEVPAAGKVATHWLAKSGRTNAFFISCNGMGTSRSEAVETDLLPGTNWCGYVSCYCGADRTTGMADPAPVFSHQHRIVVLKKGLCDTAIVYVGLAEPLSHRLVNFTTTPFAEIGCRAVSCAAGVTAASDDGGAAVVTLTRVTDSGGPASPHTVSVAPLPTGGGAQSFPSAADRRLDGLSVHLCGGPPGSAASSTVAVAEAGWLVCSGALSVRQLRLLSTNDGRPSSDGTPSALARGLDEDDPPGGRASALAEFWSRLVVRVELQVSRHSVTVVDSVAFPLCASVDSAAAWLTVMDSEVSVQCSVRGIAVTHAASGGGVTCDAVQPFSIDVAMRDAQGTASDLFVEAVRGNCSRLTVTVSDLLIAQGLRLAQQCAPAPALGRDVPAPSIPVRDTPGAAHPSPPLRIHVRSATLSEVPIVLTWDRSSAANQGAEVVAPYRDEGDPAGLPAFMALVPSIHHASLRIPKLQLTDVTTASPGELGKMVQQILFVEVLKQLPSIVGTAGLLPRNTSLLGRAALRISSLLFGSAAGSEDDGAAARPDAAGSHASLL